MAGGSVDDVGSTGCADLPLVVSCLASATEMLDMIKESEIKEFVLIIEGKNGKIPTNKPKEMKVDIQNKITHYKDIKYLRLTRYGKLLIVVNSRECAKEILAMDKVVNVDINVQVMFENLVTRFLLFDIPVSLSLTELAAELEEENNLKIKELRRFSKKLPSGNVPTETVLITILGHSLPPFVKLFFTRQQLRLFVDKPRQCQRCFRYDHNTPNCKFNCRCQKCGEEHGTELCSNSGIKCANCKGEHKVTDKQCPSWEKEAEVLRFKAENHLSLAEARRNFRKKTDSYATIVGSDRGQSSKESMGQINTELKEMRELIKQLINSQQILTQMISVLLKKEVGQGVTQTVGKAKVRIQESEGEGLNKNELSKKSNKDSTNRTETQFKRLKSNNQLPLVDKEVPFSDVVLMDQDQGVSTNCNSTACGISVAEGIKLRRSNNAS